MAVGKVISNQFYCRNKLGVFQVKAQADRRLCLMGRPKVNLCFELVGR